jgi:hypothetical protein
MQEPASVSSPSEFKAKGSASLWKVSEGEFERDLNLGLHTHKLFPASE